MKGVILKLFQACLSQKSWSTPFSDGSNARLMLANFDRLIDGANNAAKLGVLVTCARRRLVLKQQAAEELDSVREVLAKACALYGFYSYRGIKPSPLVSQQKCSLHNQAKTIMTFTEVLDA